MSQKSLDERLEEVQNRCSDQHECLELYFCPVQKTWDATANDVVVVSDAPTFDDMLEAVEAYLDM